MSDRGRLTGKPEIIASSSLWGKFGGLYACGSTLPHIVPLPNIFG